MFSVTKRMEICGGHYLDLPYESPCCENHGHGWIVHVTVKGLQLNSYGMLVDFTEIKKAIHGKLDHRLLNNIIPDNPTAENIAYWISQEIQKICPDGVYVDKVSVQESEGNVAIWES